MKRQRKLAEADLRKVSGGTDAQSLGSNPPAPGGKPVRPIVETGGEGNTDEDEPTGPPGGRSQIYRE